MPRKIHDEKKIELKLSLRRRHLHAVAIGAAVVLAGRLLVGVCGDSSCDWDREDRSKLEALRLEIEERSQKNRAEKSAEKPELFEEFFVEGELPAEEEADVIEFLEALEELERSGDDPDSDAARRADELARALFGEIELDEVDAEGGPTQIVTDFWAAVERGDRAAARTFFGANLRESSVIQTFFGGTRLEKFAAGLAGGIDVRILEQRAFGSDSRWMKLGISYEYRGQESQEIWEIEVVPAAETRRITKLRCATPGCTARPFFGVLN